MPCVVCGGLLAVREKNSEDLQTHLFCPRCEGLNIESKAIVRAKTEYLINDSKLNAARIPQGLADYNKNEILKVLIYRINKHINRFFEKNGIYTFEFGYLATLIYSVYNAERFGDKSISDLEEFGEDVTTLRDGFGVLHRAFLDAHQDFAICEKEAHFSDDFDDFAEDYTLHPSEYYLAFERIVRATVCGNKSEWNAYTMVVDQIRNFRKDFDIDNLETVSEYADCYYQLINQLKVVASLDPIINEVYETRLPDHVNIFHIEEFLENIDNSLNDVQRKASSEGKWVKISEEDLDQAGKDAFGEYWDEVRSLVIVGETRLDAHPFLFELTHTEKYNLAEDGGKATVKKSEYIYPRDYARLVKYQIFPLLKNNEKAKKGHKILKDLNDERSTKYERQFYKFLKSRSEECYLRPEISESDGSELDLIFVSEEDIHLIELKLFMPEIELRSKEGITTVNQKFDLPIFNQEAEGVNRTASGPTLPEKFDKWLDLSSGDVFESDRSSGGSDSEKEQVSKDWWDKNIKKLVVSNLTPSYIKKRGIRFLTDLEYVKLIDEKDDRVLYPIWDGR